VTRRGVLTGGTWCCDRNLLIDAWPAEDGRADILAEATSGGGSACNLAIGLRRLDPTLPVASIGVVGDDADGRVLLALADRHGIDRTRLAVTGDAATDYTLAFSTRASGRRTHVSAYGTSALLSPAHFDFAAATQRIFHLGLPGVHRIMDAPWDGAANGWVATLKRARAAGLVTNLELASIAGARLAQLVRPCLPHLDLLVVNDSETAGIAGIATIDDRGTDPAACIAAARATLDRGAMRLVAVHFPRGAVVVTRAGEVFTRGAVRVPPSEIAGANGAGDAFAAGFLYGIHEDWPIAEALALGHAAAAASLRRLTTTDGVAQWRECLHLAATWGWHPNP
jgi:sugar/nucleoside kinase (ribokinase family)